MPTLRLYNTLGRKLEEFKPIEPGKVGFYGCGPTVYNYAHIGNLRAYVFDDTLVRTLRYLGYDVKHVMNLTDVGHLSGDDDTGEDKMVKSAQERNASVLEIPFRCWARGFQLRASWGAWASAKAAAPLAREPQPR